MPQKRVRSPLFPVWPYHSHLGAYPRPQQTRHDLRVISCVTRQYRDLEIVSDFRIVYLLQVPESPDEFFRLTTQPRRGCFQRLAKGLRAALFGQAPLPSSLEATHPSGTYQSMVRAR